MISANNAFKTNYPLRLTERDVFRWPIGESRRSLASFTEVIANLCSLVYQKEITGVNNILQ